MPDALHVGTIRKNSDDELRISLDEFKGHRLLDLRIFSAFTAAKVPMPTKKGVAIAVEKIPALIAALQAAEAKANELGWIGTAR
jgi:hypothetical protein